MKKAANHIYINVYSLQPYYILSTLKLNSLCLDSSYAREYLSLDSLEKSATTSRDVRNLVSQAELVDASYRVATTDE
jgi:hypothetical protein